MDTPECPISEAATLCELDAHRLKIISTALEDGRVELGRQAIVPLQRTDEGAYYEVVVRMRDDRTVLLPKDFFVTTVERFGITERFDRWVFLSALRWLRGEHEWGSSPALCVFKPFSRSLVAEDFAHFAIQSLRESGVNPRRLCLEISHADVTTSLPHAERFIYPLSELGCRIAVGDLGESPGSFSYLRYFPADFVGIDGRLVEGMLHDSIDQELVEVINGLGHMLGKTTIAKGANSPELVDMLREMNVDYAEGSAV
jgi:EAL domain-containing protein (putative c-di-GMP-specific phosphodiesterase class I)